MPCSRSSLLTIGYGDITPVHGLTRALALFAAGGVAFEGHGLNVETPARSAGVLGGASPEAVGSPEKLQPCHRPYTFSRTTLPRGVGDG